MPSISAASWTIFHNPRCSKSRATLALLEQAGVKPVIVDYLNNPPTEATLLAVIELLGAENMVRMKDEKFREHPFDLSDARIVAKNLSRAPELLERPIVMRNQEAVMGRPPENVHELLRKGL
jgi:arsenate reductase